MNGLKYMQKVVRWHIPTTIKVNKMYDTLNEPWNDQYNNIYAVLNALSFHISMQADGWHLQYVQLRSEQSTCKNKQTVQNAKYILVTFVFKYGLQHFSWPRMTVCFLTMRSASNLFFLTEDLYEQIKAWLFCVTFAPSYVQKVSSE